MLDFVRWNDDGAITYDTPHMQIAVGMHIVDTGQT
jgi:hypothetical protein